VKDFGDFWTNCSGFKLPSRITVGETVQAVRPIAGPYNNFNLENLPKIDDNFSRLIMRSLFPLFPRFAHTGSHLSIKEVHSKMLQEIYQIPNTAPYFPQIMQLVLEVNLYKRF
jgi:hypothetical protein